MAKTLSFSSLALKKATFHLLLIAITLRCSNSIRILTEEDTPQPQPVPTAEESNVVVTPGADVAPTTDPAATTPPFSFFMHDILGGSAPSGRVVTGVIAANSQINNLPFLANLNGASTSTLLKNNNNNVFVNGDKLPFVTAGQLPPGATLQQLLFGTITVVDDELTGGHELGSDVIGKAQGFHVASSLDGTSHTMVFTALFDNNNNNNGDGDEEDDTISFFGVHRTAAQESQLAVVGGTGKYVNAKGYATIETLHLTDQHTTDGVDTVLQCNVYLTQ